MKSKLFGLLAGASIYALAVQPAAADGIAGTAQAIILTQTGHSVPNEVFVAEGRAVYSLSNMRSLDVCASCLVIFETANGFFWRNKRFSDLIDCVGIA
jgi:hypothetical protein